MAGLLESWQDAKIKLAVTALLLDLRRMQEDLFDTGGYEALPIKGKKSERALGYFRSGGDERVAVLVARFPGLRGGAIDLASLFEILPAVGPASV